MNESAEHAIRYDVRVAAKEAIDGPAEIGVMETNATDYDREVDLYRKQLAAGEGLVWAVRLPEHARSAGKHPTPDHAVLACITGNGPTSEANARFIAACFNAKDRLVDSGAIDEEAAKRLLLGIAAELCRSGLVLASTAGGPSPDLVGRVATVVRDALRSEDPAEEWFQALGGSAAVARIVLPAKTGA